MRSGKEWLNDEMMNKRDLYANKSDIILSFCMYLDRFVIL